MEKYLQSTNIINFTEPTVAALAQSLALSSNGDKDIAKKCFLYVRDEIRHSGDARGGQSTCSASEVLKHKTGWCYAKSHLLAALLRANKIPTAFCYQRLFCNEYKKDSYCLHGLNAIYLKDDGGWYKVDARGNNEHIKAGFNPPFEELAFTLEDGEENLDERLANPLPVIITALSQNFEQMINNFPDI